MPAETSPSDYAFYGPMGSRRPRKRVLAASACAVLGIACIFTPALIISTASYADTETIVVGGGVTLQGPSHSPGLGLDLMASMHELETVPAPEPRPVTGTVVRPTPQPHAPSPAAPVGEASVAPNSPPAHGSGATQPVHPHQPDRGEQNNGTGHGNGKSQGNGQGSASHGKGRLKSSKPMTTPGWHGPSNAHAAGRR